jgi:hypothetical protein
LIFELTGNEPLAQLDERSIDGSSQPTWGAFSPSTVVDDPGSVS